MYRIVKDGTTLGLTEQPNFVEPLENGSWGLCGESRAHGIVWEGKVYGLAGKSATEDLELVTLAFVDAGALAVEAVAVQSILFVNAAESGAVDDTTANEHVDLLLPGPTRLPIRPAIFANMAASSTAACKIIPRRLIGRQTPPPAYGKLPPTLLKSGRLGLSPRVHMTPTPRAQRSCTPVSAGPPTSITTFGSLAFMAGRR